MARNLFNSKEYISSSDESQIEPFRSKKNKTKKHISAHTDESDDNFTGSPSKQCREDFDVGEIPFASLSKAPKKKSSQFKVSILPRVYDKELSKDDFFDSLVDDFKQIEVIVSKEDNPHFNLSKYRAKFLFKILLDFSSTTERKFTSARIYSIFFRILRNVVGEEPKINEDLKKISDYDRRPEIIIESVKDKSRAILWATSEAFPRFTESFDPSQEFSETFRVYNWALQNKDNKFAMETPFISESKIALNRLKLILDDVRNKYHKKHEIKKCDLGPFNDWRDDVINWWNSWVDHGWHHKKQQLLIVSVPNCGKTIFIREALFREGLDEEIPKEAILIPERAGSSYYVSQFAWSRANPNYHVVVFCDEYEMRHYNTELMKVILQGDHFSQQQKYRSSGEDICLRIPMIFASNRRLPDIDDSIGLAERFLVIEIPKNFRPFDLQTRISKPYYLMYKEQAEKIKNSEHPQDLVRKDSNRQLCEMEKLLQNEEFQREFLSCSQHVSDSNKLYKNIETVCGSIDSIHLSQEK